MKRHIRLLIVDDHPVVRKGVITMIAACCDEFEIAGEAANPREALVQAERLKPDVVLTDLYFPGEEFNGIELISQLRSTLPDIKSVMITADGSEHFMVQAHDAGASAFLYKESEAKEYVRAIEAAFDGKCYFPAELGTIRERLARIPRLTPTEKKLMRYIARGLTSKEIARERCRLEAPKTVEPRTIDVQKGSIKQKFNLGSASALVAFAVNYCRGNKSDGGD